MWIIGARREGLLPLLLLQIHHYLRLILSHIGLVRCFLVLVRAFCLCPSKILSFNDRIPPECSLCRSIYRRITLGRSCHHFLGIKHQLRICHSLTSSFELLTTLIFSWLHSQGIRTFGSTLNTHSSAHSQGNRIGRNPGHYHQCIHLLTSTFFGAILGRSWADSKCLHLHAVQ